MTGRRSRLVAIALLLVVGGVAWYTLPRDDVPPRDGSVEVDGDVDVASRTLETYSLSMRDDVFTEDGVTTTNIEVTVRRPFEATAVSDSASGDDVRTVSRLGRFTTGETGFFVEPTVPAADLRPGHVLERAVDDGYAEVREVREVAGRRCRIFRIGDGVEADSLAQLEDAESTSDVCVDEAGLVLEVVTYDGDDIARRRVVLELDEGPEVSDDDFEAAEPRGDPRQVGSFQRLRDDSRIPGEEFWQLPDAPRGFELVGRFAVVPPGQPGFSDIAVSGQVVTFLSEVWSDGTDVIVIDQGSTRGAKPFEPDPQAIEIEEAGELTDGELRLSMRMSEVRFLTGGVRFVRVRGTVTPDRLIGIAGELEATEGGPLQLADPSDD